MSPADTSTGSTIERSYSDCEQLRDQSPSAKLVYRVLDESESPLTTRALSDRTLLSPRTTRYALRRLREVNLVIRQTCPDDPRQYRYQTAEIDRTR
ncbi:MarR family transcriptional regulator [Halocatena salina]|uniref:MarR family transcriptional regulator n=1 Tax=Halocatena salina TaxID=2934340 RepID=A0A8U0A277_9EURY|nr:MarR family transcriptional regulator [Halocatena salina]UPM42956.1 MarR family transcriptional regulator [Halocatena salina]